MENENAAMNEKVIDGNQELAGADETANELTSLIQGVKDMSTKAVLTVAVDLVLENVRKVQFLQSEVRRLSESLNALQKVPANIKDGHDKPEYTGG